MNLCQSFDLALFLLRQESILSIYYATVFHQVDCFATAELQGRQVHLQLDRQAHWVGLASEVE